MLITVYCTCLTRNCGLPLNTDLFINKNTQIDITLNTTCNTTYNNWIR